MSKYSFLLQSEEPEFFELSPKLRLRQHGGWLVAEGIEQEVMARKFFSQNSKANFLGKTKFNELDFHHIIPDNNNYWINQIDTKNNFETLIQLMDKNSKNNQVVFGIYSNGISTNRDEWVYDLSKKDLNNKLESPMK